MKNKILSLFAGTLVGALLATAYGQYRILKVCDEGRNSSIKMTDYYFLLAQWLKNYHNGIRLDEYLKDNSIKTVAVYGIREMGELLIEELQDTDVQVKYIIDRDADSIFSEYKIVTPDDELDDVDAVIVTAVHYYEDIKDNLSKKMDCRIVSLKDMVMR